LKRDPHAGDLYVFRGARGNLVKILWHAACFANSRTVISVNRGQGFQ
jgi:transposase